MVSLWNGFFKFYFFMAGFTNGFEGVLGKLEIDIKRNRHSNIFALAPN
jgi:hypothetical protein